MRKTKKKVAGSKIGHGSESWPSKYDIVQHKYMAGDVGFIEVLEVEDQNKYTSRFFLHNYDARSQTSAFSEWKSLENAMKAFKQTCGFVLYHARKMYIELPGFMEMTDCPRKKDPWFYET